MDTIVALATPIGRSGIGVIRLSGPDSLRMTRELVADERFTPDARVANLKSLCDPDRQAIDEAVVTYFKGPHSFTGEDVVEISCHGSPVLLRQVIDICLAMNARLADPGEFTLRALSNGRIDLAEAEAIRDIIDAQTGASVRQAVRQLRGELSLQLQPLKDKLLDVVVILESALEFVEDDLPSLQAEHIAKQLMLIVSESERLASTFKAGKLLREGLRVALVGRPNVGKSSLFNALLGSDRAIVTHIAGTTRDHLHERLTINDIPISLIDTAGLRDTTDIIESIGVERARAILADADIVLVMLDASENIASADLDILEAVKKLNFLVVVNKIDKTSSPDIDELTAGKHSNLAWLRDRVVPVSAKTLEGLNELRQAIVEPFSSDNMAVDGFLVTDARHHDLLKRTSGEVEHSLSLFRDRQSEEIVLIGLHNALRFLGQITGETTTEDMLTRIFSTFCIGK